MITPPPISQRPRIQKPNLWQRYLASSKQQKTVIPIGILVLVAILGKMINQASAEIKLSSATDTPTPTLTNTYNPPTLTATITLASTITLTPTITDTPTLTFTPTNTFTPTVTMTPTLTLPAAAGAECVPPGNDRVKARVVRITDGDTIVVNIEGIEYKLRYIGMDAPEAAAAGGNQSTYYNTQLVQGKNVTLVKDVSETDRYDRLLRYVFVGNIFVNYEMIRAGYGSSGSWPPDTSCDQAFANAFATSKANKLGLWAPTATARPYVAPPVQSTPGASSGSSCSSGCTTPPSGCLIKGNISSSGEKIYHVPGGGSYSQTVISPDKGERWFCTEAEATANGWRKAKN